MKNFPPRHLFVIKIVYKYPLKCFYLRHRSDTFSRTYFSQHSALKVREKYFCTSHKSMIDVFISKLTKERKIPLKTISHDLLDENSEVESILSKVKRNDMCLLYWEHDKRNFIRGRERQKYKSKMQFNIVSADQERVGKKWVVSSMRSDRKEMKNFFHRFNHSRHSFCRAMRVSSGRVASFSRSMWHSWLQHPCE